MCVCDGARVRCSPHDQPHCHASIRPVKLHLDVSSSPWIGVRANGASTAQIRGIATDFLTSTICQCVSRAVVFVRDTSIALGENSVSAASA